jgi:hypothetical protein
MDVETPEDGWDSLTPPISTHSITVNQIMLGMSAPLALYLIAYFARGARASMRMLVLWPLAMLASGTWAVIPDFPRLWGDQLWYTDLHHHRHCWIWFNHCRIDKVEVDSPLWILMFVGIAVTMIAIAWRELARAERGDGGAQ